MDSPHTILLICEGQKSEPLFFDSIRDKIIEGFFDIGNVKLEIYPEPPVEKEIPSLRIKHKRKRKKRTTKDVEIDDEIEIISAPIPLNYVLSAQKQLETGAYDEVWTVFDHDDHPARKEAFDTAKKSINGKQVQIAFSSRSFEYYILLHFERIYRAFNVTACKINNKNVFCGNNAENNKDCFGDKCINGYAKTKGFWENNKAKNTKNKSVFNLIMNVLDVGFQNAEWIRYKSDEHESEKEIYDRNPYITTDFLVKRLIGFEYNYKWIRHDALYHFSNYSVRFENNRFTFYNTGNISTIINKNSFQAIRESNSTNFGEREFVEPNDKYSVAIEVHALKWYLFKYNNDLIMFENKA